MSEHYPQKITLNIHKMNCICLFAFINKIQYLLKKKIQIVDLKSLTTEHVSKILLKN